MFRKLKIQQFMAVILKNICLFYVTAAKGRLGI